MGPDTGKSIGVRRGGNRNGNSAMPRRSGPDPLPAVVLAVMLAPALAPVLGSAALAQVASRFDGQYAGELTLNRVISGDCTEPPHGALYPLTIAAGQVSF